MRKPNIRRIQIKNLLKLNSVVSILAIRTTQIQIKHLLKLNPSYHSVNASPTTIQIKHLLKLNMELKDTAELMLSEFK